MWRRTLVGAWLLLGCGALMHARPQTTPPLGDRLRAAEQRLAQAPDDSALMFEAGALRARAGDRAGALALFERIVANKTGVDPQGSGFDLLKDDPKYQALLARLHADFPPVSASALAFTIPEPDLIPEGIAYDPASGRFFVGSTQKFKIVSIARDGRVSDFVPASRDGLGAPLGLRVDPPRGLLWAAAEFRLAGPDGRPVPRIGVAAYELSTGRLARRVLLESPAESHLTNDLVVTKAGDVYVTDSRANELYHLAPGGARLERILDSTQIQQPNGIVLAPDESQVFIAAWPSIVVMDLRSTRGGPQRDSRAGVPVTPLRHGANVVTGGLDGLYFYKGSLIGVQNGVHPGRVVRYELSADLRSVVRMSVLESYNPCFEAPTTGAIANGSFYVIANSQLDKIDREGKLVVPVSELKPVAILRTELGW